METKTLVPFDPRPVSPGRIRKVVPSPTVVKRPAGRAAKSPGGAIELLARVIATLMFSACAIRWLEIGTSTILVLPWLLSALCGVLTAICLWRLMGFIMNGSR